jgi:PhnB protein
MGRLTVTRYRSNYRLQSASHIGRLAFAEAGFWELKGRNQNESSLKQTPVAKSKAEVSAYLVFSGQCEAAFKFYEKCLGGKIEMMMTFGDSPMSDKAPADWQAKVMHARMTVGKTVLMGSDAPPERYEQPKGFSMSVGTRDAAEAEWMFNELAADGKVQMPLQQTFWAVKFGMVVDRFGIPWMVNCEQQVA